MGGYHYWKGGDHARDQVGVDPTTPAVADAEPAHPVWGYPFPGAGPPDLDHAIQAATKAIHERNLHDQAADGFRCDCDANGSAAVRAAAPVLLQATRDRLADLEDEAQRLRTFANAAREFVRAEELDSSWAAPAWAKLKDTLAALDGPAAQEEDDQACDACGELFTHDPQCGYLADSYRDGTEGRQ